MTLLRNTSARAAALGGAFTAAHNDAGVLFFNPAGLVSLDRAHIAFAHERGFLEDTFHQFLVGSPLGAYAAGAFVGHYDGGDIEYLDDNFMLRNIKAQNDLTFGIGLAGQMSHVSVGVAAKYLSSELAEQARASALAADVGVMFFAGSTFRLGLAAQNIGQGLRYGETREPLPGVVRGGCAFRFSGPAVFTFLADSGYQINEREHFAAVGMEADTGMIKIRGGYRLGRDGADVSVGTGLSLGQATLDYAVGLARELESRHQVTFSIRLGVGT